MRDKVQFTKGSAREGKRLRYFCQSCAGVRLYDAEYHDVSQCQMRRNLEEFNKRVNGTDGEKLCVIFRRSCEIVREAGVK